MKTKSLLAALVAVSVSSVAFGSVSSNIVGYTTLTLTPNGYSLVGNTLSNPTSNFIPSLFNNNNVVSVFRWNGTGFIEYDNLGGTWIGGPTTDYPLNPGEAVFVQTQGPASVTLIGQVATGTSTTSLGNLYNFVSSVTPLSGALDTALGYTPTDGDAVFTWNGTNYVENDYLGGWISGSAPVLNIGDGIVIQPGGTGEKWVQTFTPSSN